MTASLPDEHSNGTKTIHVQNRPVQSETLVKSLDLAKITAVCAITQSQRGGSKLEQTERILPALKDLRRL